MVTGSNIYDLVYLLQICLTIFQSLYYWQNYVRHCKPKNNTISYRNLDATAIERINTLLPATYWSPLQQLHINDKFDFVNTKLLEEASLMDISHTYGCNYDIEYNPSKSSIMYIDSRKAGNARSMTIGGKILNVVTAFTYLGHIICDDLSDEADLKAKSRQMYAKSNTLRNKFHMCSTAVKVKLFTAYFNNVYMCALWANYRQTAFQQFKVSYNNSYRILNRLPMRCSASNMFANGNVNSCACVLRKSIYSLMTRIHASLNPIVNSIVRGDVYCTSALRIQWVSQLYNM